MRLIDADALKHEMEKLYEHHLEMCNYSADGAVSDCIEFLDNAPTIDAAPLVHGEWIWTERGDDDYEQYWVYSKCGQQQYVETNYCPDCGAKMDGGKDAEE